MSEYIPSPTRRLILIGASNLTLGFPLIVNSVLNSLPRPVEIFAAHGHGRSFCNWSYVLHRGLPSILDCGLWSGIASQSPVEQTWGLVTDVGNDLIYGVGVDVLVDRLRETFRRLREVGAKITFVRLPLQRILMLTDRRYRIVKQMLFPGPTVPWKEMSQRVVDLDEQAAAVAAEFQATVLTPRLQWYGIDPIHIRQSQRVSAWNEILQTWTFDESPTVLRPSYNSALRLWRYPPAERTYWKRQYRATQPVWKGSGNVSLWLY